MMKTRAARALLALIAAIGVVGIRSAAQQLIFTGGTDVITVDVLVTDGHGKAVTGLGVDDFRIVEKGRPQKIEAFTFISVPPVAARETDPAKLPPVRDVITNHVTPHSRAFVVLIDDAWPLSSPAGRT